MVRLVTTRKHVRIDLHESEVAISRVIDRLTRSGCHYEAEHPDLYRLFCMCIATLDIAKDGIKQLHRTI